MSDLSIYDIDTVDEYALDTKSTGDGVLRRYTDNRNQNNRSMKDVIIIIIIVASHYYYNYYYNNHNNHNIRGKSS